MGYSQVALDTVKIFKSQNQSLQEAWKEALIQNNMRPDKVCPRTAFFGLCECGYVIGVPQGNYVKKPNSVIKQKAVGIRQADQ